MSAFDGHLYVVKRADNPRGLRLLINEFLTHVIMKLLGVDTPPVALAFDDEQSAAVHFASRVPADVGTIWDFLPDQLLGRVLNRDNFLGALVIDQWVCNADGRQSIFYRIPLASSHDSPAGQQHFVAQMIDNDQAFQGAAWRLYDSPQHGLYGRASVYGSTVTFRDFLPWIERAMSIRIDTITSALRSLPRSWVDGDEHHLSLLLFHLMRRRDRLPELLRRSVVELHRRREMTQNARRAYLGPKGVKLADGTPEVQMCQSGLLQQSEFSPCRKP